MPYKTEFTLQGLLGMSDDNVVNLKPNTIQPFAVINTLKEREAGIKAIYVVTFEPAINDPSAVVPTYYASGRLDQLCMAAIGLDDLAKKFLRGEILRER
jgi:hypothetical protein